MKCAERLDDEERTKQAQDDAKVAEILASGVPECRDGPNCRSLFRFVLFSFARLS
jgi:hypothetical protein